MAVTIRPRQAIIRAARYADSADIRLVPIFHRPWKILAVAFRTLDGL